MLVSVRPLSNLGTLAILMLVRFQGLVHQEATELQTASVDSCLHYCLHLGYFFLFQSPLVHSFYRVNVLFDLFKFLVFRIVSSFVYIYNACLLGLLSFGKYSNKGIAVTYRYFY
jgi:hypothetical protein